MKTKPLPGIYKTSLPLTVAIFLHCKNGDHGRCLGYAHQFNQHAQCDCGCHDRAAIEAQKTFYANASYYGDK